MDRSNDIINNISQQRDSFSKTELLIAEFICQNPDRCAILSIQELAGKTGSSEASIIRFCKKIDYKGYQELRTDLKARLSNNFLTSSRIENFCIGKESRNDKYNSFVSKQLHYMEALRNLVSSSNFDSCAKDIINAGIVYIYDDGGASATPVHTLLFWLSRYGIKTKHVSSNGHRIFDDIIHAERGDIFIGFRFGKDTPELIKLLSFCRKELLTSYLITDSQISIAAKNADYLLTLERGPGDIFHSMSVPVVFCECLTLKVAEMLGSSVFKTIKKLDAVREENNV